jgi:hypothetical protein
MNIDKIIQKIRNLFKESFFYKKLGANGIISHINATRPYPLAQINLALTQIVTDPNEYVHDKYGRLGHVVNVADYYIFQPIELTDSRSSIYDRSIPVPYKHESVTYPLTKELTEDYLKLQTLPKPVLKEALRSEILGMSSSNTEVVKDVERMVAKLNSKGTGEPEEVQTLQSSGVVLGESGAASASASASAASIEPEVADVGEDIQELLTTLNDTLETCKTIYEKHTKDHDEWYYYCGKVIKQLSETREFNITEEKMHDLVIANLIEHLFIKDSKLLINYLYHKNNNSMFVRSGGGLGASVASIQPLTQFEQKLLSYYSQQLLRRPLGGRRAAAVAAAAASNPLAKDPESTAEDLGLMLFNEGTPKYELIILRYETPEWIRAEHEDERDFSALITAKQSQQIKSMNGIIGFVTFFKNEYLIFKVKMMTKKRDKGARCDQAGKSDTIAMINNILSLYSETNGDEYKMTTENTKDRTQKELCVFQEFVLRVFNANRVNGKKWFFTPSESILCDIEKLHLG